MKKTFRYFIATGILAVLAFTVNAQTDTLTKPGRPFQDPKASDDNSKVLIDTSENVVDSLMDKDKAAPRKHKQHLHPMKESVKPGNGKKAPVDERKRSEP